MMSLLCMQAAYTGFNAQCLKITHINGGTVTDNELLRLILVGADKTLEYAELIFGHTGLLPTADIIIGRNTKYRPN